MTEPVHSEPSENKTPAPANPIPTPTHSPLQRARPWLQQRLALYQAAQANERLQGALLAWCQRDPRFWFRHFCWTFDPRLTQPHLPFIPYEYQEKALLKLIEAIEEGQDLLVEKSRDMGISWLILMAFQYCWLFRPGSHFHVGSRKLEAVDRKGDLSTLMEKLRYNLAWLPHWMRPHGFEPHRHDNLLRLINPENGNMITGESSNENFGRGGRYKAILFDEFPFWTNQNAAFASAGQSSPCRILVGTPYGKHNRFAQLRFSDQIAVLRIHWQEHPFKDATWYQQQQRRLSEDEVARELDINYHLSLKNRVFKNFSEQNKADLSELQPERIIRSWDFGYHCPVCLLVYQDDRDRLLVLKEIVGKEVLLTDFAESVKRQCEALYPNARFEDICDPAGSQRSDKSVQTSIEILNSLGIYPHYDRTAIKDGLSLMRILLEPQPHGARGLQVDYGCTQLIEAFEGGYRYTSEASEMPFQEHPYEDVMDCLRYAVVHKMRLPTDRTRRQKMRRQLPSQNRYAF